jgi:hypothetical protein
MALVPDSSCLRHHLNKHIPTTIIPIGKAIPKISAKMLKPFSLIETLKHAWHFLTLKNCQLTFLCSLVDRRADPLLFQSPGFITNDYSSIARSVAGFFDVVNLAELPFEISD